MLRLFLLKISIEQWEKVVNVNLHDVFHMVATMLPGMLVPDLRRGITSPAPGTAQG